MMVQVSSRTLLGEAAYVPGLPREVVAQRYRIALDPARGNRPQIRL